MKKEILSILASIMMLCMISAVSAAITECIDAAGNPVADNTGAWPAYNDTGVTTNVTAGRVCINVTDYDVVPGPGGYCGIWSECIAAACSYDEYYVGYTDTGEGNCYSAGWVATGNTTDVADNYIINASGNVDNCSIVNVGETPVYTSCPNFWTRQGGDGYCDGAGSLDADDALTNVSAGNVCTGFGVDANPDVTTNCDLWYDCADNGCTAAEYYVGYVGDGTTVCVDTGWVASGSSYNVSDNYIMNDSTNGATCSVTNVGETATYDACANAYTRQGPDGYCDGVGALDANDASLHVAAGKVCVAGANAAPNSTLKCGTWGNCVLGATTVPQYYVGYAASGTSCSDTAWVSAGSSLTLATGLSCKTTEHAETCPTKGYAYGYTSSDFSPIIMDAFGTAGAGVVSWADLAVTLLVILFIVGAVLKYKGVF